MLLGHARGKVGDLVFARVNGQQVTRARATVVKNPQTEKQMIQRIMLNTIIQAYSRMSEICDHSFEGVPVGQASMNKFMKENMNALRAKVAEWFNNHGSFEGVYAFSPKGLNMFTPNEYKVSTGQLPEVTIASLSAAAGATIAITSEGAIPTYGEIIASLGLQRGDQLTFIGQELYTDGRAAFKFARVILDPRETDGTQAELTEPFLVDGVVNKPSPRNEGSDITFSSAINTLTFDLGESSQFGACVIVSREKADGSWLRSNASIVLDSALPYALVGAMDLQEALDYTMSGGIDLESDRYLNNAVRGTKIIAGGTPTPATTRLTTLKLANNTDMLDPTAAAYTGGASTITFAGSNLEGCWLIQGQSNQTVGDSVDVSTINAGRKYEIQAESGTTSSFSSPAALCRLCLVKDGRVVSIHRQWQDQED